VLSTWIWAPEALKTARVALDSLGTIPCLCRVFWLTGKQGAELDGSVYRVAATIPVNGVQFDPEGRRLSRFVQNKHRIDRRTTCVYLPALQSDGRHLARQGETHQMRFHSSGNPSLVEVLERPSGSRRSRGCLLGSRSRHCYAIKFSRQHRARLRSGCALIHGRESLNRPHVSTFTVSSAYQASRFSRVRGSAPLKSRNRSIRLKERGVSERLGW